MQNGVLKRTSVRPFFSVYAIGQNEEPAVGDEPASESEETASWLLKRVASGDERATEAVFQRYAARLAALARSRLSKKLSARIDADDIVMSAYRSFFIRARQGAFTTQRGGDLWRLLVEITLHKLYRQNTFHTARRRSVLRESEDAPNVIRELSAPITSPDVAVAAAEEVESIMAELSPDVRAALELRLQGHDLQEIARALDRSERTIRRWLEQCKTVMRRRFPLRDASPPVSREHRNVPRRISRKRKLVDTNDTTLAFDDFVLKRQIGAGTTGKVYLAMEKRSHSIVAIKFLRKRFLHDPEVVSRFAHEAHLLQQFEHPGIIRIFGLGRTPNDGFFLAMTFVPGGDLGNRLGGIRTASEVAIDWVSEAASALEYAHQRKIIHCDLKPSNLLLRDDGRIVVTDFGLARTLTSELVGDEYIAGTPAFMAPEQVEPDWGPLTVRTDVYGLGAILYSLLAGRPPHGGNALEVLAAIGTGRKPPIPTDTQPELAEILRRCLSPNSEDRFPTAASVADALDSLERRTAMP
jgi:DNA-directed RNA polymerase specialized sigma24 family protein/tRNA A-37 threonylcarbamoyl transferase component Bud32